MVDAIVAGLGNPGTAYQNNRHNAGYMFIDALRRRWRVSGSIFTLVDREIILCKPEIWLNLSGRCLRNLVKKFPKAALLVCHDDIALPLGVVKVKHGGGAGGHNGIRSIDNAIGPDYARLRIGIGHPGDKTLVHQHVLSDFSADERPQFQAILESCLDCFDELFQPPEPLSVERLGAFRSRLLAQGIQKNRKL